MSSRDHDQTTDAFDKLDRAMANCHALVEQLRPRSGNLTDVENAKLRSATQGIYEAEAHVKSVLGE